MTIIRHYQELGNHCDNPGDNLVERGARSVLSTDPDAVYLIGTPWFWDKCEESEKYKWLEERLKEFKSSRIIAIGIGSCLPLGGKIEWLLKEPTIEVCKRIWSQFDRIAVRDVASEHFLKEIGLACKLLPCPSVLFPVWGRSDCISSTPGSCLFIDAPCFHEGMKFSRLDVSMPADCDRLTYQPGYYDLDRLHSLFEFCLSYETIISARLHAALPLARHRKVAIVPVDSRSEAAAQLGIPLWPAEPALTKINPKQIRKDYQSFLS